MVHPPDYDPGEGHDFECQTQYENEAESKCDEGTKCVLGSQCSTKGKNPNTVSAHIECWRSIKI